MGDPDPHLYWSNWSQIHTTYMNYLLTISSSNRWKAGPRSFFYFDHTLFFTPTHIFTFSNFTLRICSKDFFRWFHFTFALHIRFFTNQPGFLEIGTKVQRRYDILAFGFVTNRTNFEEIQNYLEIASKHWFFSTSGFTTHLANYDVIG